jgi:AcrR family transcriptional regulator
MAADDAVPTVHAVPQLTCQSTCRSWEPVSRTAYDTSVLGLETRPSELSARARICRAALRSFAERGFAGTSIRRVATEAGVSAGLVQHYFRTKGDLAAAVEELAMARLREALRTVPTSGQPNEVAAGISDAVGRFVLANPDLVAYARRSVLEAGTFGHAVMRMVATQTGVLASRLDEAGLLRDDVDPAWVQVGALVLATGPYLLQPWLEEITGHAVMSTEFVQGWNALWTAVVGRGVFRRDPRPRP